MTTFLTLPHFQHSSFYFHWVTNVQEVVTFALEHNGMPLFIKPFVLTNSFVKIKKVLFQV